MPIPDLGTELEDLRRRMAVLREWIEARRPSVGALDALLAEVDDLRRRLGQGELRGFPGVRAQHELLAKGSGDDAAV